jgi:hypothetical protein
LGNYAVTIQAGTLHDSVTACIHVDKFPKRTLAVFERVFGQTSPAYPFRLYSLNIVPEIFTIYHHFLDTSLLFSHHADLDQGSVDNGQTETHEDAEWSRLAQSYLLGLRLEDEKFCNAVVDGLIEKFSEVVSRITLTVSWSKLMWDTGSLPNRHCHRSLLWNLLG